MSVPVLTQPDCLGLPDVGTVEPIPGHPSTPALVFIVVAVIALAVFELWALHSDHHTISQVFQKLSRAHHWLRFVGVVGMFFLTWHLFFGGPL